MPPKYVSLQVPACRRSYVDRSRVRTALWRDRQHLANATFLDIKMKKSARNQRGHGYQQRVLAKGSVVVQRALMNSVESRDDLAARVAWMHFLERKTQHEIADALHLSRPTVNRPIAYATKRGLVTVRVNHPLAECVKLAEQLRARFNLSLCEVAPPTGTWKGTAGAPIAAQRYDVF